MFSFHLAFYHDILELSNIVMAWHDLSMHNYCVRVLSSTSTRTDSPKSRGQEIWVVLLQESDSPHCCYTSVGSHWFCPYGLVPHLRGVCTLPEGGKNVRRRLWLKENQKRIFEIFAFLYTKKAKKLTYAF